MAQAAPKTNWWVEGAVYGLVFFTPLALGTAHLWSAAVMLGISVLAFSALVLRKTRGRHGLKLFSMGLALLVVTALTLLQIVPVPKFVVRLLSPGAAELYDHVLADTGLWAEGNWRVLSLDPPGTAWELVSFMAYLLAFLVVVNYFQDRHRARRLMKAVAWSGFTVALVGFFSKLFVAQGIYGVHPVQPDTFFFATFVNPNHLAGFLGLCAPVALGLALSSRERQGRALYGFMGVITGVGVFMSLSRGGMVAFCLGCVFLFFFAATRRAKRLKHTVAVQALAAGVLVVAGYLAYDTIITELKTLGDPEAIREDIKIRSWAGTFPMMADHPVVGIGRGAYATVYPRYKTVETDRTFTHAENQVLQSMVEWGPLVGLAFCGVFVLCFLLNLVRARQSFSMGGCLAGLFVVALHNLVDFNLEVGGVAMPFVVVLGIVTAATFTHTGAPLPFEARIRIPLAAGRALVALVAVAGVLCVPYAAAHGLERQTQVLLAIDKPGASEPCTDTPLGAAACDLMRHHPSDFMAPLVVGKAYLEGRPPGLQRAVHWLSRALYLNPSLATIHRLSGRALYLGGYHDQALMAYRAAARWDPRILTATTTEVLRLTGEPQAAIRATPEDAQAYLKVARILRNLGKDQAAARAGRMALELDSTLMPAMDLLAELALAAGRLEETLGLARQAVQVDPLHDRAYFLQGQVYFVRKEPDKGEQAWLEGLAQKPDSTLLAYQLGEFYLRQGRIRDAERIAAKLQAFAPSDDGSQARLNLLVGRLHEAKGLLFEARRSYRLASTLAPGVKPYLYHVGRMEEKMGNFQEAERIYRQLLQQRFRVKQMERRLEAVQDASKKSLEGAMWDQWIEEKP